MITASSNARNPKSCDPQTAIWHRIDQRKHYITHHHEILPLHRQSVNPAATPTDALTHSDSIRTFPPLHWSGTGRVVQLPPKSGNYGESSFRMAEIWSFRAPFNKQSIWSHKIRPPILPSHNENRRELKKRRRELCKLKTNHFYFKETENEVLSKAMVKLKPTKF